MDFVLRGRYFNRYGARPVIEYAYNTSKKYLEDILIRNKRIDEGIVADIINTFLESKDGRELYQGRSKEFYTDLTRTTINDYSLINMVRSLYNFRNLLSKEQLEKIIQDIYKARGTKVIDNNEAISQLKHIVLEKDIRSLESSCLLCLCGEFNQVASAAHERTVPVQEAKAVYLAHVMTQIHEACEI